MKYDPKTLKEIWKRVKAQLKRDGTDKYIKVDDSVDNYLLRQIQHYTEEVNKEQGNK